MNENVYFLWSPNIIYLWIQVMKPCFFKKHLHRWYTNILIGTAILTISVWAECTSLDPAVFLQCVVRRGTVTAPYKTIKCSKLYIPSTINTWEKCSSKPFGPMENGLVSSSLACKPSKTWNLKQNRKLDFNPESIWNVFSPKKPEKWKKWPMIWTMNWYFTATTIHFGCQSRYSLFRVLVKYYFESVLNFPTFSMSKKIAWVWCNLVHIP